jgi:molecular chaperone HscA
VRVTFQVDADGLLSVAAKESTSGVEASVTVKPSYGLADADIERMLRDSFEHAREDVHARALAEQRVDGQRLVEATRSALQADASLLSAAERQDIDRAMAELEKLIPGTDHRAIKHAIERLNHATEEFAARRMDAGIKRALAGKKIGSL